MILDALELFERQWAEREAAEEQARRDAERNARLRAAIARAVTATDALWKLVHGGSDAS